MHPLAGFLVILFGYPTRTNQIIVHFQRDSLTYLLFFSIKVRKYKFNKVFYFCLLDFHRNVIFIDCGPIYYVIFPIFFLPQKRN